MPNQNHKNEATRLSHHWKAIPLPDKVKAEDGSPECVCTYARPQGNRPPEGKVCCPGHKSHRISECLSSQGGHAQKSNRLQRRPNLQHNKRGWKVAQR